MYIMYVSYIHVYIHNNKYIHTYNIMYVVYQCLHAPCRHLTFQFFFLLLQIYDLIKSHQLCTIYTSVWELDRQIEIVVHKYENVILCLNYVIIIIVYHYYIMDNLLIVFFDSSKLFLSMPVMPHPLIKFKISNLPPIAPNEIRMLMILCIHSFVGV